MKYHGKNLESHYFSYKADMAAYHVGSKTNKDNIKSLIQRNPFFYDVIDNKPWAEAVLDYSWVTGRGRPRYTLIPHGILTAKRGLHCKGPIYIDDALQDPAHSHIIGSVPRVQVIY